MRPAPQRLVLPLWGLVLTAHILSMRQRRSLLFLRAVFLVSLTFPLHAIQARMKFFAKAGLLGAQGSSFFMIPGLTCEVGALRPTFLALLSRVKVFACGNGKCSSIYFLVHQTSFSQPESALS